MLQEDDALRQSTYDNLELSAGVCHAVLTEGDNVEALRKSIMTSPSLPTPSIGWSRKIARISCRVYVLPLCSKHSQWPVSRPNWLSWVECRRQSTNKTKAN